MKKGIYYSPPAVNLFALINLIVISEYISSKISRCVKQLTFTIKNNFYHRNIELRN